jgi:TPR repeat protein/multisubunit Na+/H+ antiporter MnhC subunit
VKLRSLFLVLIVGFFCLPFVSRGQEDDQSFEQMARSGDVKAQTVVGLRSTNLVQSFAWLSLAARNGNETATRFLPIVQSKMYQKQIEEEGYPLAGKLYREIYEENRTAARQKAEREIEINQTTMVQKARQEKLIIDVGFNVPDSAVVAALNGDAIAQDTVAGWSSDWVHQYAWYSLAAAQGNEHAAKFRAQVLRSLSPQIEKGEQLIRKLEIEIKQNQTAAMQKAEQKKAAALQKAEQEKKVERALAESVGVIEKQEQAAALQREEQAAIEQQKEKKIAQGGLVTMILAVCAVLYALYLARHWLKLYWGIMVVALIILLVIIGNCTKEKAPPLSEQERYELGAKRIRELEQKFGKEYADEYIRKH